MESDRSAHNQYQRTYFDTVARARLALADTPYVMSHVERVVAAARLKPGQRILEVGAGPGKFTLPLAGLGLDVVANDLSPVLLERLHQASGGRVKTLACDVAEIAREVTVPFDAVVGFFVLHHLRDFEQVFKAIASVMQPGARVVFCEPVAWNPLYYLQILLTPGMRFAGEPSLISMRSGVILPALRAAGFVDTQASGYGYFPPVLKNHPLGNQLETWLDRRQWIPFPHAFQLFTARLPA